MADPKSGDIVPERSEAAAAEVTKLFQELDWDWESWCAGEGGLRRHG